MAQLSIRLTRQTKFLCELTNDGRKILGPLRSAKYMRPVELVTILEDMGHNGQSNGIASSDAPDLFHSVTLILPEDAEVTLLSPTMTVPQIKAWMASEAKKGEPAE